MEQTSAAGMNLARDRRPQDAAAPAPSTSSSTCSSLSERAPTTSALGRDESAEEQPAHAALPADLQARATAETAAALKRRADLEREHAFEREAMKRVSAEQRLQAEKDVARAAVLADIKRTKQQAEHQQEILDRAAAHERGLALARERRARARAQAQEAKFAAFADAAAEKALDARMQAAQEMDQEKLSKIVDADQRLSQIAAAKLVAEMEHKELMAKRAAERDDERRKTEAAQAKVQAATAKAAAAVELARAQQAREQAQADAKVAEREAACFLSNYCSVCRVLCNSQKQLEFHRQGLQHCRLVARLEQLPPPAVLEPPRPPGGMPPGHSTAARNQGPEHTAGGSSAQPASQRPTLDAPPPPEASAPPPASAGTAAPTVALQRKSGQAPGIASHPGLCCALCDVPVTSPADLELHERGRRHKARVRAAAEARSSATPRNQAVRLATRAVEKTLATLKGAATAKTAKAVVATSVTQLRQVLQIEGLRGRQGGRQQKKRRRAVEKAAKAGKNKRRKQHVNQNNHGHVTDHRRFRRATAKDKARAPGKQQQVHGQCCWSTTQIRQTVQQRQEARIGRRWAEVDAIGVALQVARVDVNDATNSWRTPDGRRGQIRSDARYNAHFHAKARFQRKGTTFRGRTSGRGGPGGRGGPHHGWRAR